VRRVALALLASTALTSIADAEPVPDVALSADAAAKAALVDAPIAEVTVYSDRARVRRRGKLDGKAGTSIVRFPELPGALFLDTVRVAVAGGRVLRVEATPVERERLSIDQATKRLDELEALDDRLAEIDARTSTDDWEVALLGRAKPAPPVPEDKREGRKALAVDVASWGKAQDFVADRAARARERLVKLADERREVAEQRQRVRAELEGLNQGGFSSRVVRVAAVVQGAAGASVELEYFLPGASWRPAYDLDFSPRKGQLHVETSAVVTQATGEDWPAAALSFSTAIPGRGIDAPELLTWTLGERSDFLPVLRPRGGRAPEPTFPPPRISPLVAARDADAAEAVRERLARAMSTSGDGQLRKQAPPDEDLRRRDIPSNAEIEDMLAEAPPPRMRHAYRDQGASSPPGAPAMAPAAMPMSVAQAAPREYAGSVDAEESEEEGFSLPKIFKRSKPSEPPPRNVGLELYSSGPVRAPSLTDPMLPAVSAGGLDYVYPAPTSAAVASDGRQVRVPLASQTFPASAFHEATPALSTTAFLRAKVRNDGKRPLLRGPATIFSDGELVGVGELQTTGPGGEIEFPLGADQDVRLVRTIVPTTKTTGLIVKTDETVYDVTLQVGNYKKQAIQIDVRDQLPRSQRDKIEVKLLQAEPAPAAAPDADGVVRWRLDLPPGATRTVKLRYQITRPKGWILYQP
jgi:hypothetical protein